MKPVFPYLVRRSEDGARGELLLRLKDEKSAYIFHLPLEQARTLAVEMRGLSSHLCPQHHMTVTLVQSMGGDVSHLVIRLTGSEDAAVGEMRMLTPQGLRSVTVDPAAGLSLAIHMGLPIFMDGEFALADGLPGPQPSTRQEPLGLPKVFQELIDGLELPDSDANPAA